MTINYAATSRKGTNRNNNHDRLVIAGKVFDKIPIKGSSEGDLLAVLCDGVGDGGGNAADIACQYFIGIADLSNVPLSIFNQLAEAESAIEVAGAQETFATTIAGVYVDATQYIAFNMGDTRIYGLDEDKLEIMSEDHTRAQAMKDAMFARRAEDLPSKTQSTITRYLGDRRCHPTFSMGRAEDMPKRLAICSDGIYRSLGKEKMKELLSDVEDISQCCETLMDQATEAGFGDDMSVIVLEQSG